MNDKKIKFGIVIPFYGVEKFIGKCLESLAKQTYMNFIAILVDDGSKDDSRKIAENYVQKYPSNFKIIEQVNQGQGEARNYGFRNLPEDVDYFLFLDSDDYLDNTLLEKVKNVVSEFDYDILTYNFQEMDPDGHVFGVYNLCGNKNGPVKKQEIKKYMSSTICVQGRIYNRKFWAETGALFPSKIWYEDAAITSYVISKSKSMYLLNESLYYYIQRSGSVMNNKNLTKMMDIKAALNYLKELFIDSNSFEEFKKEVEAVFAISIINTINRLNMFEKGIALQTDLSSYLFNIFPECINNENLTQEYIEKLQLVKKKRFKEYFLRYSMKPITKSIMKSLLPQGIVTSYKNWKYK